MTVLLCAVGSSKLLYNGFAKEVAAQRMLQNFWVPIYGLFLSLFFGSGAYTVRNHLTAVHTVKPMLTGCYLLGTLWHKLHCGMNVDVIVANTRTLKSQRRIWSVLYELMFVTL